MKLPAALGLTLLILACAGPATGPVKGVLVVYDPSITMDELNMFIDSVQLTVTSVKEEDVFDFSVCTRDLFQGDLRSRRTVLFLTLSPEDMPEGLEGPGPVYQGSDLWAEDQVVLGAVLPGFTASAELSRALEDAYDRHLADYIYGSFVATQMSSPQRIDSLLTLGFSMDIPKSYGLESWRPETGFIQYQRVVSDQCLLILTIRWLEDGRRLSPEEAVLWRESVARNFFYDAGADSVDRSRVQSEPLELHGATGMRLLGMWRNPEHLNAGAFTSYILFFGETRFLLDLEVFHEHREKEPYIREGWIIMNTFVPGR